jgi:hypothetical protein
VFSNGETRAPYDSDEEAQGCQPAGLEQPILKIYRSLFKPWDASTRALTHSHMLGYQGRRSSTRDVGVGLLAQASNTYCAHDFAT